MHAPRGETEQRLYLLNAWRESPVYTERERAALEWTEAVTLVANTNVPDDVYEMAARQFKPDELANLTLAIATINSWNSLSIAFRAVPGSYDSHLQRLEAKPDAIAPVNARHSLPDVGEDVPFAAMRANPLYFRSRKMNPY
jgi:hypothetical protein